MIDVVIVDDQPLVREGLAALLTGRREVRLAGQAGNSDEAMELLEGREPCVVLLDVRMPEVSGLDLLKEIRRSCEGVRVVMLTTFHDDRALGEAVASGADGYLLKDATLEELLDAIQRVWRGERVIRHGWGRGTAESLGEGDGPARREGELSGRETEVLQLMASGMRNEQIGRALGLATGTVRNHVSEILGKLGVKTRTQAVLRAIERGWI